MFLKAHWQLSPAGDLKKDEYKFSEDKIIGRSEHESPQEPLRRCLHIQGLQRQVPCKSFPGREPPIPHFRGVDQSDREFQYVSYDPPVIQVKLNELIPGTELYVRDFVTMELDEILLARLQRIIQVKKALGLQYAIDYNTEEKVWQQLLRRRERNFATQSAHSDPGMPMFVTVMLSGILYGGLHALGWNSATLTTNSDMVVEDILRQRDGNCAYDVSPLCCAGRFRTFGEPID